MGEMLIGPVSVIPLVIAIVQMVKGFFYPESPNENQTKQIRGLAVLLGAVFGALSLGVSGGYVPQEPVVMLVTLLWFVAGPSGVYLASKEILSTFKL